MRAGLFHGKKPTLTISAVDIEELEGDKGKEQKAILSFAERPLQLVLCKLNGLCLKAMYGSEVQKWVGRKIVLFATSEFMSMGEDCIRIWGGDIQQEISVPIKFPRRREFIMMMHKLETK